MTWFAFLALVGLIWLAMISHFFAWKVAAKEGYGPLRWFFLAAATFAALAIALVVNAVR